MSTRKKDATGPVHRIFVRIGALRRFHTLTQKTATLPVEVTWDRRRDDRRSSSADGSDTSAENGKAQAERQPERRQKPPFTWEMADFVVVEAPAPEAKRRTKKS